MCTSGAETIRQWGLGRHCCSTSCCITNSFLFLHYNCAQNTVRLATGVTEDGSHFSVRQKSESILSARVTHHFSVVALQGKYIIRLFIYFDLTPSIIARLHMDVASAEGLTVSHCHCFVYVC